MIPDEQIRKLIADKAALDEIRQSVLKTGMRTMREDGLEKVGNGLTSREEVLRVTQEE
jgi:general secretion pathway protein E